MIEGLELYAKEGELPEGGDILSAIVNTIDTIREGDLKLPFMQSEREEVIVDYILRHFQI